MPDRIHAQHVEAELRELARHADVEPVRADAMHRAGVHHDDRGPRRAHAIGGRGDEHAEQAMRLAGGERGLLVRRGLVRRGRTRRWRRRRGRGRAIVLAEPRDDRVEHLLRHRRLVRDRDQELVAGQVARRDLGVEAAQLLDQRLLGRNVRRVDHEDLRRRPLRELHQIERGEIGDGLRGQEEAERLFAIGVRLGAGREALGLEHAMHLVHARGLGGERRAVAERMPQHDRRDITARGRDIRRERRPEPQPDDRDVARAAARAQLVDRDAEIATPGRDAFRIALVACRVAGAVEIEAKHRVAGGFEVLGQVAQAAMRADVVIAERIADHHRGRARRSRRLVKPTEQARARVTEIDRRRTRHAGYGTQRDSSRRARELIPRGRRAVSRRSRASSR